MRTHVLKINVSNLKRDIENDYFRYKELFYRCLIVGLCVHNSFSRNVLHTTIIEDSHYNQFLMYLAQKVCSVQEMIAEIDPVHAATTFIDMNLYLDEFLHMKHDNELLNLYSLTIDDTYNIVITNKQIKRPHAQ